MKHLNTISSGLQSAAKLIFLLLFLASASFAADASSPFASIVGVWSTRFGNDTTLVYRITPDGRISYEHQNGHEFRSATLSVMTASWLPTLAIALFVFNEVQEMN